MSARSYILLNWIALIAVLTINGLANGLPINGHNTAEVAAMYPNLFVPAGFTFGIWGFIYLLHVLHVAYSTYILSNSKRAANDIGKLVMCINPLFWLTCFFNTCWILAWHFLYIWLSVFIMLALFITLLTIFKMISVAEKQIQLGYMEHISLETPFIIYFSWINVALIANLTALLVSKGWHPDHEIIWTCIMIAVAGFIGVWFSVFYHRPAFTAVIIWALFGIYCKQSAANPAIGTTVIVTGICCLLAAVLGFWYKRKLMFRPSVQVD